MAQIDRIARRLQILEAAHAELVLRVEAAETRLKNAKGIVVHDRDTTAPRPDFLSVEWIGYEMPANAETWDTWVDDE